MSGKIKLPHKCPSCNKTVAQTEKDLSDLFGYRTMNGGVTNQSYCKACRSK